MGVRNTEELASLQGSYSLRRIDRKLAGGSKDFSPFYKEFFKKNMFRMALKLRIRALGCLTQGLYTKCNGSSAGPWGQAFTL